MGRYLTELDKKLIRLKEDPLNVGGWFSGELQETCVLITFLINLTK